MPTTLSRKGAKNRARVRGLRSTGTKATRADLERKLAGALEQLKATSDVLGIISSSPGELELVARFNQFERI